MNNRLGVFLVFITVLFFVSCERQPDTGNSLRTLYKSGVAQFENGDYKSAVHTLQRVIQLDSEFADAYLTLARIYDAQKNYGAAVDILIRLTSVSPDLIEAHHLLGDNYIYLEKDQDAETAFKKSVTRSAHFYYEGLHNLAEFYNKSGNHDDAYKIYAHLLNLKEFSGESSRNRSASLYYELGITLLYQHDPKKALSAFRKSVYFNRSFLPAYFPLGMVYVFLNKKESAMQCYVTLFNADSDMAKVLYEIVKQTKSPGEFEEFFAKHKDKLLLNK